MKTTSTIISLSAILACLTPLAQGAPPKGKDAAADPRLKLFEKKGDEMASLPKGKPATFASVQADQFLDLNLTTSQSSSVRMQAKP